MEWRVLHLRACWNMTTADCCFSGEGKRPLKPALAAWAVSWFVSCCRSIQGPSTDLRCGAILRPAAAAHSPITAAASILRGRRKMMLSFACCRIHLLP